MIFNKKIHYLRLITRIMYAIVLVLFFVYIDGYLKKFVLVITVLGGVYFCGWMCPFGAIQEYIGKLGKKILKRRYKLPKKIHKYFQWLRYFTILLIPLGLSFIILIDPQFATVQLLSLKFISSLALISVLFFAILSFFVDRPFCNYFCAEGAKMSLVSLVRLFTIRRDSRKCINCKACEKVCTMNLKVSEIKSQRHPSCVNCFECITVCPVKALDYGFCSYVLKFFKKQNK